MSQPERTRVSRWTQLRSFVVDKYKAVQLSIEKSSFESKLETIVRLLSLINRAGFRLASSIQAAHDSRQLNVCKFHDSLEYHPNLLDAQIPAISEAEITRRSSSQARACNPGFFGSC